MKVIVKLFAVARQRIGKEQLAVELPMGATVGQLRRILVELHPTLADVLAHARLAVKSEYAAESEVIPEAAEVAIIPPVSGG
jgi:molybdopterin converting factor subunit 1